jgi:hypothetical protein
MTSATAMEGTVEPGVKLVEIGAAPLLDGDC